MKKLFAMVLALAMALSMCSFAVAEDAPVIKIGVIGPMTGDAAVYGMAVARGAQIAADEITAQGDFVIELNIQDDENDPEKGMNAYGAVLDWGAQMILGTVTTAPCVAVSAQAFQDRVFMLTPSASSADVTANKDNAYQVCFTDPAQGTASAQYIFDNQIASKIGIIYNSSDIYSMGIRENFIAKANELGLEIVADSAFIEGATDMSVQVTDMKNAGAELVYLPIYYTPASQILAEASRQEYAPIFFGVDGMDGILTVEGFDTALAEDVILLTPFSAVAEDELTQNFVAQYQAQHGEIPNQFAADAYDGIYALYQASVNAGITTDTSFEDACDLLIAQFQTLEITGTTGIMTWESTGEVSKIPVAVIIKDGAYANFGN